MSNRKEYTFSLSATKEEIKEKLEQIILEKASMLSFFKGRKFEGVIKEDSFNLRSYDAPPVEVSGKFLDNQVRLIVKWDSMKNSFTALFCGLGYPAIFVVGLIHLKDDPFNLWIYLLILIALPVPILFSKIWVFFNYSEPNPDAFVQKIIKHLKK